jgi:ketosteroid isomerase-like protein
MPSTNVDLVRSITAQWERGEILPSDSSTELVHPEVEIVIVDGPEPSSSKGLAAATPGVEAFLWSYYLVEVDECRELDDERVLVLGRVSARGRSSGVEIAQRRASVFHVRDGKVIRLVMYWDRDHALADLGLAPDGPS